MVTLILRIIPDELYERLKREAASNGASSNDHVIAILSESVGLTYTSNASDER